MPAAFMCEREPVPAFNGWVLFRIQALMDEDLAAVHPYRAKDVRLRPRLWYLKHFMEIVEIDRQLEVFLDDVFDRNRWF